MFCAPESSDVYIYTAAADMRLGIDRLAEKIRVELKCQPLSGGYFVFLSRNRRKVRVVYWDKDGYAMWLKRLEAGSFKVEVKDGYEKLAGIDLSQILSGMDLARIKLRKSAENGLFS